MGNQQQANEDDVTPSTEQHDGAQQLELSVSTLGPQPDPRVLAPPDLAPDPAKLERGAPDPALAAGLFTEQYGPTSFSKNEIESAVTKFQECAVNGSAKDCPADLRTALQESQEEQGKQFCAPPSGNASLDQQLLPMADPHCPAGLKTGLKGYAYPGKLKLKEAVVDSDKITKLYKAIADR